MPPSGELQTTIERAGRRWQIMATRSAQSIEWRTLVDACASADIVVSSREGEGATFSPSGVLKVEAKGGGLIEAARGVLLEIRAGG